MRPGLVEPQHQRRRLPAGHVPRNERDALFREAKFPGGLLRGLWQAVHRAALPAFQPRLLQRSAAHEIAAHLALAERIDVQSLDQQSLAGQRDAIIRRAVLYRPARLLLGASRGA
jgi:hypothetical protein